jgi:hypothetical protein
MTKQLYPDIPPALNDAELAALGVLLGANGKGAEAWSAARSRLEVWNGTAWVVGGAAPSAITRRVLGIASIDDVTVQLGPSIIGVPTQWLYGSPVPFQLVAVVGSQTTPQSPLLGLWRWDDSDEWIRPSGWEATTDVPYGSSGYFSAGNVYVEYAFFGTGMLNTTFKPDGSADVLSLKRGYVNPSENPKLFSEILNVTALNTISALSKTPVNLSNARLVVGSNTIIPTHLDGTRGGFTLNGTNNRTCNWVAANAFDIAPGTFPVVCITYETLE